MATLIKTDGSKLEIQPQNGLDFQLDELQKFVDGYIDIIVKMETAYKAQEGKYGNIKENVSFYGRDKREKKEKKILDRTDCVC